MLEGSFNKSEPEIDLEKHNDKCSDNINASQSSHSFSDSNEIISSSPIHSKSTLILDLCNSKLNTANSNDKTVSSPIIGKSKYISPQKEDNFSSPIPIFSKSKDSFEVSVIHENDKNVLSMSRESFEISVFHEDKALKLNKSTKPQEPERNNCDAENNSSLLVSPTDKDIRENDISQSFSKKSNDFDNKIDLSINEKIEDTDSDATNCDENDEGSILPGSLRIESCLSVNVKTLKRKNVFHESENLAFFKSSEETSPACVKRILNLIAIADVGMTNWQSKLPSKPIWNSPLTVDKKVKDSLDKIIIKEKKEISVDDDLLEQKLNNNTGRTLRSRSQLNRNLLELSDSEMDIFEDYKKDFKKINCNNTNKDKSIINDSMNASRNESLKLVLSEDDDDVLPPVKRMKSSNVSRDSNNESFNNNNNDSLEDFKNLTSTINERTKTHSYKFKKVMDDKFDNLLNSEKSSEKKNNRTRS